MFRQQWFVALILANLVTLAISETNDVSIPTIVILGKREDKKTRLANILLGKDAFNSSATKTSIKSGKYLGGGNI